jgi:2'-5' RNA ligase
MTLPQNMIDRWAERHDPQPGEQTLYWHVLMAGYPEAGDLAHQAAGRLAPFSGLHLTPPDRLHMTTLLVGPAEHITSQQLQQMTQTAARQLDGTKPIPVSLGKILYHAQAIMLAVTPAEALAPIRDAAMAATQQAGITPADRDDDWTPHVTLCYSTASQPARPIIDALGKHLPEREISITSLSLVIQDGPERQWNWTTVGTTYLHQAALT